MNIAKTNILLALTACAALAGCKKYDDGPVVSMRSREGRVANTWRVEQAMDGGQDVTGAFQIYRLELTRERNATLDVEYSINGTVIVDYQTTGKWYFMNNQEEIQLDFPEPGADATYQILRLMEKELWIQVKGDDLELHLVPL